ncbi:chitooligosaccharidolytic beta-N-acetylglucosaminidase-like isoform X1 [Macrosteles quadrilineatus]|uniref:chitooligosaccharidolytic beta-N-acetylglucosaminidase-like isoform X1 n=1 Tax=Macrosteles quadrilineatus TaxID=74068 RepID=UPI0023E0FFDD|nr:chitooligosaccharidolytic beta-N-acetylglucosaminidase-like isoform X1 [Macrosteles quadrilineatus]
MRGVFLLALVSSAFRLSFGQNYFSYPYTWKCEEGRCIKQLASETNESRSLNVCMLQCSAYAGIWPRPQHLSALPAAVVPVDSRSITITSNAGHGKSIGDRTSELLEKTNARFRSILSEQDKQASKERAFRNPLLVSLLITEPEVIRVTQDTDESYNLTISTANDGKVIATISCYTYFGCRHGLETLAQVVVYDHVSSGLVVPRELEVRDFPLYRYRGILLDTARNYVSVKGLYRLIDAMAANKLNTFHWHITDSHSFPFQSQSFPQLTQFGAYSPDKVYTEQDIRELVEFARVRGVRIIPELDAPAHVGEGWQWTDPHQATVCFKKEPWQKFCVEPPCGQINPTSDYAYTVLQGIYKDMEKLFDSDLFHMGGDEVNLNCWNSTESITDWMKSHNLKTDEDGFHRLWDKFQTRALQQLDSVSQEEHPIVLWTSSLTEKGRVEKFLDNSRYIIQIWTTGNDAIIAELVNKGFRVIFSNYDALYFDCGFGAWVGEGNNWCSPYIGWQKVYENNPLKMLMKLGVNMTKEEMRRLVLGQEATLWTEQADDQVIDQRLWPRAAAMAERLWSDPEETWKAAEHRFLHHRERMVSRGVRSDTIEPLWCLQNQGHCYL